VSRLALLIAVAIAAGPLPLQAAESPGAAQISLDGGDTGPVPFPHLRHQQALKDCMACHETFPQAKGAIAQLKAQGTLQPKQVMNKLCTACHKRNKAAGKVAGPITCTQCHHKS